MYTRDTELRRLQSNDVNRLAETLGFDGGRKLMETIPKNWTAQDTVYVGDAAARGSHKWNGEIKGLGVVELKYKPEQIRLIEEATRQTSGCYFAEILIQEWSTSGRKHERPTVGLLLHLLIKADLWNAADFVAEHFLNEAPPDRPLEGPGAKVDISIPTECLGSVADFVNDSAGYPDTETLNDNANCVNSVTDHNRDYYTKFPFFNKDMNGGAPKPPPRAQRMARQQNLQTHQQKLHLQNQQQVLRAETNNVVATADTNDGNLKNHSCENLQISKAQHDCNSAAVSSAITTHNIPELSELLEVNSSHHSTIKSEEPHNVPMLTLLDPSTENLSGVPALSTPVVASTSNVAPMSSLACASGGSLPLITELNLDTNSGEPLNIDKGNSCTSNQVPRQNTSQLPNPLSDESQCSSLSNDSFDDDGENCFNGVNMLDGGNVDAELTDGNSGDQSLPCLSVFGHQSPSNDSSLTTVTCTSGDNSFELSLNDSSSTSTTDPTAQRK
ncbi:protein Tube [Anastrepha obliqua]|uniref:protein Tube n=1 Tax=Anastrepha obliqua TaxID=95512 RepID=UPI00240915D8|nr:protein Tube [Anastrepha obliqua]